MYSSFIFYIFSACFLSFLDLNPPSELPIIKLIKTFFFFFAQVRGHTEDILTIDFSGRVQLATGSYDGNVIVWSMETSKKSHHIRIPKPEGWSEERREYFIL
jgi:WD40 repeat protein